MSNKPRRWEITWDVVGKTFEVIAWICIILAAVHVGEFIIVSLLMVWTLFVYLFPEQTDRVIILMFHLVKWIVILGSGLTLSYFRIKKKK